MVEGRTVVNQDAIGVEGSGRRWSLRREWSRAFSIMLLGLLVTGGATIVGVRGVVDQVEGTAHQLHLESKTVAALTIAIVDHEEVAHKLLSDESIDRSAFVRQQQQISGLFDQAATLFPTSNGMRATIVEAHQSWQKGLTTYGLWGNQVQALQGDHSVDNPLYGASSDGTVGLLNGLEGPSLNAMDAGLAYGSDLERILIIALSAMFVLGLAATVHFRRRMAKDLMRPVAAMHDGVLKLQSGDYNTRLEVARRDELGELAQAFNRMAEVLHGSHLALTLRATHDSLTGLPTAPR
jgi:HAMP domain-containing protein